MEYTEFLEFYGLPSDLPKSTNSNATENLIPLGKHAELMGTDLNTLRNNMGWDSSFTEETTIGEAVNRTKILNIIGDISLESFKEYYGLGDDVTGETLYGTVRHQIDLKKIELIQNQLLEEHGYDEQDDN